MRKYSHAMKQPTNHLPFFPASLFSISRYHFFSYLFVLSTIYSMICRFFMDNFSLIRFLSYAILRIRHFWHLPFLTSTISLIHRLSRVPFSPSTIFRIYHSSHLPFFVSTILPMYHFVHLACRSSTISIIYHFVDLPLFPSAIERSDDKVAAEQKKKMFRH